VCQNYCNNTKTAWKRENTCEVPLCTLETKKESFDMWRCMKAVCIKCGQLPYAQFSCPDPCMSIPIGMNFLV
jgi:hypothetical protein